MTTRTTKILTCLLLAVLVFSMSGYAADSIRKYDVHDKGRKNPPVVEPPARVGQPPADAIVLFDGEKKTPDAEKTSEWVSAKNPNAAFPWKLVDGHMEVKKKAGGIRTKKSFGSCQLHIEWRTPEDIPATVSDQKRSNSGIHFMGKYEVQILDSYTKNNYKDNKTYADGQAASLYGQHPPIVNVCRPAGEWQTYDVSFLQPLFDEGGKVIRKARITVLHNGAVVHNNLEIEGTTFHKRKASYKAHGKAPISLQDHGNPLCFRNIWIRELPEQPYLIK